MFFDILLIALMRCNILLMQKARIFFSNCFKPVIGQGASIVYCTCAQVKTPKTTDETISKQQHRNLVVEQKKKNTEQRKISMSTTWVSLAASGSIMLLRDTKTEQLLLDNTATTHCIQWFT
jgi:uncharacterized membrane protein